MKQHGIHVRGWGICGWGGARLAADEPPAKQIKSPELGEAEKFCLPIFLEKRIKILVK